jgi:hypothetical protein
MSDAVSMEAIGALESALVALLPGAVPAPLTRRMRVVPTEVRPLGLGAYVGQHLAPDAPLLGRRVAARLEFDIVGGPDATAQDYAAALRGQLLANTRAEFAQRGIRRLRSVAGTVPRNPAFDVDFEFVKLPDAGEGLIDRIALDDFANLTPYRTRTRFDFSADALATEAAPLAAFAAVDDADLDPGSPAGLWALVPAAGATPAAIVQTTLTRGGPLALDTPGGRDAHKAGAMLLLRPGGAPLSLTKLVLRIDFSSTSPDGVGLVFRRRALDDHWFFLASQRHGYQLFGRRTPAGWSLIAAAAEGFATGAAHRLVVAAYDDQLWAELDGRRTLTAQDAEAALPGEVGLLTHGNDAARFLAGHLMELL